MQHPIATNLGVTLSFDIDLTFGVDSSEDVAEPEASAQLLLLTFRGICSHTFVEYTL
jgi:hypothetical protein